MIRLCLMGCGVLVQTPESSLVAGMKWLQGTYTQRYNSLHELFGHLFQGRYKAVIVDGHERRTIFRSSAGRRRESHSGPARVAHGEAAAGRLLAEGLAVLGLSGATLGELPRSAPEKQVLAWWLRVLNTPRTEATCKDHRTLLVPVLAQRRFRRPPSARCETAATLTVERAPAGATTDAPSDSKAPWTTNALPHSKHASLAFRCLGAYPIAIDICRTRKNDSSGMKLRTVRQYVLMGRAIMSLLPVCIGGVVVAAGALPVPPVAPVSIIFDTDMGGDCDDVGALFILHGAVERGEARLLATMGCTSSDAIAPCLNAINAWFGRPEIPVGTLKDPGFLPNPGYSGEIVKRFPHQFATGRDYRDAVMLYRQVLAKQPDGSVVVLAVGPLRNLANLLQSGPDEASPLDGPALLARKVKRLEIMGGTYPPAANAKEAEWNFKQDPAAAALVCSNWPTAVLFNGEGGSTCSGRRVTYEMPEHNPLTMAYRHYPGVGFAGDRLSWDCISSLVAVRGAAPWYKVVSGGVNVTDATTGINTWKSNENRNHSYLVLQSRKSEVEKALEDMMVAGKGRPANLTFNTAYYADAGMCQIRSRGAADAATSAIKAFDHDDKTAWLDKAGASWIQCQYADGRKYRVTSYAVVCSDKQRLPKSLELSGSNDDGDSWTRLDVQEAPVFNELSPRREFNIAQPAKWNLYRLAVTAVDEREGIRISEFALNEAIHCRPAVAVAAVTLDQGTLTLPVHGRATLNATLSPLDACEREVAWVSSDPAVAEVRRIGEQVAIVVGKQPGACIVTATSDKGKQTCAVTVTPSPLPAGWRYDELNAPPIPGAVAVADGRFTLTGCGHAMSSWWERVRDQGVFVSQPVSGEVALSARLTSLAPNVGGPLAYVSDNRPSTAAGLMIRESLTEKCGRFLLIQVDATGNLVCRWRSKTGDQDDNQKKDLGKATLPLHLKLVHTGQEIRVFASADGQNWGEPRMTHPQQFDERGRIGFFVCSGNTFSTTTAVFDSAALNP